MQHQDWCTVVFTTPRPPTVSAQTQRPIGNKKHLELLHATDAVKPEKSSLPTRLNIQKARMAKGMTQKNLANAMNLKVDVIQNYESGSAVPDKRTLSAISKVLGQSLRG